MSEILEILFGTRAKARLLRFFLQNPDQEYLLAEVAKKNLLKNFQVRKEIRDLKKIKFITKRVRKRKNSYILNQDFPFYPELRNLIVKSNIYPQCRSLGRVKGIGEVKLALISGTFLNYPRSKADIVVVANNVNRSKLRNVVSNLEAEIGKEISYVLMNSEEFKYRLNMTDRFLLDFLEGPHDEIVNKIPTLRRFIAGLKR
ncbi:MAG: hypothetical protein NT136_01315 [Candidatus Moranbacteria bacterium]|nr:hypothetical protein [Candidatus Moranbacteria bacterium]